MCRSPKSVLVPCPQMQLESNACRSMISGIVLDRTGEPDWGLRAFCFKTDIELAIHGMPILGETGRHPSNWTDKRLRWEGLCEVSRASGLQRRCTRCIGVIARYEYDRQRSTLFTQPPPQINSGTITQIDVEDNAKSGIEIGTLLK
jgi:hypothetical protein